MLNLQQQIVVVGAGVAGLSAALGLRQLGLAVTVLERGAEPEMPQGELQARVSAISPASQSFLTALNAWPDNSERVRPYQHMWIWTDGDFDSVHFSAAEIAATDLGAIAENALLQHSLYLACLATGVGFRFDAQWQDIQRQENSVKLVLAGGDSLTADWLIAADGAQSSVRDSLKIVSRGWQYQQHALVCSVQWGAPNNSQRPPVAQTAWQRFLKTGPLALLPLATGESSLVWSLEQAEYQRIKALSDGEFVQALNAAINQELPADVVSVGPRFGFPLRLAQAEQYRQGRCILLGDAAHGVHPLAGHGLNLGILDARDLVAAFANGASSASLATWERKRRAKASEMMLLTDGLYRLFRVGQVDTPKVASSLFGKVRANAFRSLVSAGMSAVGGSSLLRQQLARAAISDD